MRTYVEDYSGKKNAAITIKYFSLLRRILPSSMQNNILEFFIR